ncbi:hypothetical protein GBA52_026768 [Prunus armeniaca]|nr:hypothetical protein GBA52_026708 [Prunus armeniaca]KAH0977049.1 hypothetical protein GBA52_026768 [Prunus armeniaca]
MHHHLPSLMRLLNQALHLRLHLPLLHRALHQRLLLLRPKLTVRLLLPHLPRLALWRFLPLGVSVCLLRLLHPLLTWPFRESLPGQWDLHCKLG